jgi:hypothetical protein
MLARQSFAWDDVGPVRLRSPGPVMVPGQAYSYRPVFMGGMAPYSIAFIGTPPAGLSTDGRVISGTPAIATAYPIRVTDRRGRQQVLVVHPQSRSGAPRLWIVPGTGQSNHAGATSNSAGVNDPAGPLTRYPPRGGQVLCFVGGTTPLDANPSAVSKGLTIGPARFASVVDAREDINPFVQRETWNTQAARVFAASLPETDKVLVVSTALGSCAFPDLVEAFSGSRATFSGSITGTTMTVSSVTVDAGIGLTNELLINHPSILPGTRITAVPDEEGNVGVYQVSPAQEVPSFVGATTSDPPPKPWSNLVTLVTAAVEYALANGLEPIIPAFLFNQGEAEQDAAAPANRTVQLNTLGAKVVNDLASLTGQSFPILIIHPVPGNVRDDINHVPPENVRNNTPDASLMHTVSPASLAAEVHPRRNNPLFATFAQYDQEADAAPRVHYLAAGHRRMGMKAGNLIREHVAGRSTIHPYMARCTGNLGSTTRIVTLSEDCVIDTSEITDPGQRGVRYYDSTGELTVSNVAVSGTTLTLTLATAPSGQSERVEVACSNALITGSYSGTTWPFTRPPVYIGPLAGQRSQLRAVRPMGFHEDTGAPLHRYLPHQRLQALIGSSSATVRGVFTDLGVTPTLVIDASDSASYSGSGQTITDRSPAANAWQRGINGSADATDPSFVAAAGADPAHFLFNGFASITPSGTPTFADDWHKAGAAFTVFAAFFLPSVPPYSPSQAQYLLSTCADATAGIGIQIRVSNAGRWGVTVRNGTGLVLNLNSSDVLPAGWNVCAVGINAAAGQGWFMTTPGMGTGQVQSLTPSYASPSAAAKANGPFIGKSAVTADTNSQRFISGGRINAIAACGYQTAERMRPLYTHLAARCGGLPIDLSGNV